MGLLSVGKAWEGDIQDCLLAASVFSTKSNSSLLKYFTAVGVAPGTEKSKPNQTKQDNNCILNDDFLALF